MGIYLKSKMENTIVYLMGWTMKINYKRIILVELTITIAIVYVLITFVGFDIYDGISEGINVLLGLLGVYFFSLMNMPIPLLGWGIIFSSFVADFLDEFDYITQFSESFFDVYDDYGFLIGMFVFVIGLYKEISRRQVELYRIERLATVDSLTGLYSRNNLVLAEELVSDKTMYSLAAIMIDLNGLKFVNDSFGHVTGDKMLQKSSDIITKVFSKKKDLIYRIGGDEFLILRPNTSEEEIRKQCLRIKLESNKETCNEIPISFSIGYSLVNEPGMTLNDIMAYADDRMYMDKLVNRKSNKSGYLKALKNAVKEKSYETSSHDDRIVNIVKIMGTYINLDKEKMDALVLSASLHDIGKIGVSEEIIKKKNPLTESEWKEIKRHPEIGCRIVNGIFPSPLVEEGILHHHERWDGNGYPSGLKGQEIPVIARIITLADSFDTMIQGRRYKKPMKYQDVIDELIRCSGKQFDPEVVEIFLKIIEEDYLNINEKLGIVK